MTRARFKTEVKLFALNERAEGKRWPIIRQHIEERYKIPPPTVRAMEKWSKSLDRESISAEMMKDVKAQLPKIQATAQMEVGQRLLPVILQAKESGQDMEAAAWRWFFQWMENWIGREKFISLINEYLSEPVKHSTVGTEETKQ